MKQHALVRRILVFSLAASLLLGLFCAPAGAAAPAKPQINSVTVTDHTLKSTVTADNVDLIDFSATYPDFGSAKQPTLRAIDKFYADNAIGYYQTTATTTFKAALEDYRSSLTEGFPFHMYGAGMTTDVPLNDKGILSTFTDQYIYTGGAHGTTVRSSATWNLSTGKRITLRDLFKNKPNYKSILLNKVLQMADENMKKESLYYDGYRESIKKYFNVNNFFLTPKGIVIYFQQYEIAPYAVGFVLFEIPYADLGLTLDKLLS